MRVLGKKHFVLLKVACCLLCVFFTATVSSAPEPSPSPTVVASASPKTGVDPFFTFFEAKDFPVPPAPQSTDGEDVAFLRSKMSGRITQEGIKQLQGGEVKSAEDYFWKALAMAPNNSLAYSFLAQIYFREGQDGRALRMLEQAGRYSTYGEVVYGFLKRIHPFFEQQIVPDVYPRVSLARFKDNKKSAICFSFDDGTKSVYTLVLPIFDEFGYKATVLVNPAITTEVPENPWWGSWEEWRDASRRGHEISSHSLNHWDLTIIPPDIQDKEVAESFKSIEENIGTPPLSFAFPFDHANSESINKVAKYYRALRDRSVLEQLDDKVFLPVYGGDKFSAEIGHQIIDLAITKRLWIVAECHAAKTEEVMTFKPITTEFLRDHLSYIKERDQTVWVDTFANQDVYLQDRKATKLIVVKDGKNRIIFKLVRESGPNVFRLPLTVVINPAPAKPEKVGAKMKGEKTPLPARIHDGLILVDVPSAGIGIEVEWR